MLTIFDLIENKTETWIKEEKENNQLKENYQLSIDDLKGKNDFRKHITELKKIINAL